MSSAMDAMVREDLQALDGPLGYVGAAGCTARRDEHGDIRVSGPWDAMTRRMLMRARVILDGAPDLPRQVVAHWHVAALRSGEQHLMVVATSATCYVLVHATSDLRMDDVSGIIVPGAPHVVMRADHGDDLDALGEHFARLKCALHHTATHSP